MKRLFEDDTICRLCLRLDEKVFRVNNKHHKAFIESIIRIKQTNYTRSAELYVCYICSALLTKSFNFVHSIWRAQKLICAIILDTKMVTKELVYLIDRHTTGLNPITLGFVQNRDEYEVLSTTSLDSTFNEKTGINANKDIIIIDDDFQPDSRSHTTGLNPVTCLIETQYDDRHDSFGDEPIPETNEKSVLPTTSRDSTYNENKRINVIQDIVIYQPDSKSHTTGLKPITGLIETQYDDSLSDKPIPETNEKAVHPTTSLDSTYNEKTRINVIQDIIIIDDDVPTTSKDLANDEKTGANANEEFVILIIDDDFQPDSTVHLKDSDHASHDDERKSIKRNKDARVYPMKCDHCDFEVLEKRNHYRHYLVGHPNIEYPYKHQKTIACSICGLFFTKKKISSHRASHTTQELKCFHCPKVFPTMKKRQRHVVNVHPKNTLTCDYCDKIYKTRESIKRHIRTHTGSKPFKCHICGQGFAHVGNRSVHIRVKHLYFPSKPKTPAEKGHTSDKNRSTDAEISSDSGKTVRKTNKIHKRNKQSANTEVTLKKQRKTTKKGSEPTEVGGHSNGVGGRK